MGQAPGLAIRVLLAEALQEAVDALASGREAVAAAVVERLSCGGAVTSVWDFDTASRELICRMSSLTDLVGRRVPLGFGVAGWVASMRAVVAIGDRRTDRRGDHLGADPRIPLAGAAAPIPGGPDYTGGVLEVYGLGLESEADLVALGRLAAVIAAGSRGSQGRPVASPVPRDSISDIEGQNRRMAAELHDGVSQRLASLTFHLAAATAALAEGSADPDSGAAPTEVAPSGSELASDPVEFAMRQLRVAAELTQLAADDVRAAITGLRPPVLDDLGLARGLVSLCGALGSERLAVEVDVDNVEPPFVSPTAALALYRVAQEALGNAVKHAGVASLRLRLLRRGSNIVLEIRDDGAGYEQMADGTARQSSTRIESGFGLRSMAERMASVGGVLELWSAPGRGAQVRAIIEDELRDPGS